MSAARLSRKLHKWITLVVGMQFILWAVGGFYMVAVDIDVIHGDMLVKNLATPIAEENWPPFPIARLLARYPAAEKVTLKRRLQDSVYLVQGGGDTWIVDGVSGEPLPALSRDEAIQVARHHYAGAAGESSAEFIVNKPPGEIRFYPLPQWRVDFDDYWGTSFYVDPQTGGLTTRRHTLWRVFDFFWMLHIMDYDEREDVNNALLRVFSVLGVALGLSGIWLLFYSFNRAGGRRTGAGRSGARGFIYKLHKWLSLVLAAQVMVWLVSGALISFVDSGSARGTQTRQTPVADAPLAEYGPMAPIGSLPLDLQSVHRVELASLQAQPVYRLSSADSRQLFDARSGRALSVDRELALDIGSASYRGGGEIQTAQKLEGGSDELRGMTGPLWKIDFDDPQTTRVYVSAQDGRVLAHRNDHWRLVDLLLMLHFMDYARNDDFNNPQIILFGFASLWLSLSGLVLLFYSFSRRDFRI